MYGGDALHLRPMKNAIIMSRTVFHQPFISLLIVCSCLVSTIVSGQDTITIQTFTWDSVSRSAYFNFPDIPAGEIERINMIYNMRCHNAVVGNGQTGCKEWDYSCNTFITDTNRIDSSLAYQPRYVIPNFSGVSFPYANQVTKNCIALEQIQSNMDSISSQRISMLGMASGSMLFNPSNSKYYFLYQASECTAANLKAGLIHVLRLAAIRANTDISFLKIRMQNSNLTRLDARSIPDDHFTEVYFNNTKIKSQGDQDLLLHHPFAWDGTSGILVEISYNSISGESLELSSFNSPNNTLKSVQKNFSLLQNGNAAYPLDKSKLSSVSSEITISFWSYGTSNVLPVNTVIFEAVDASNNRQLNVHLPWSNGSIYWDCGNDGSGYDRIEKAANPEDYEGKWVHWTFTKNSISGSMKIYKNGSLWMSGTGKKKNMLIERMNLGGSIDNSLSYYGRIKQFCIWNKELDSTTIQNWIIQPGNALHPNFSNLLYYFPLNDNSNGILSDLSPNPHSIQTTSLINWHEEKGRELISDFESDPNRPTISFIQGIAHGLKNTATDELEEFENPLVPVTEYEIKKGRAVIKKIYPVYPAGQFIIRNEKGDSVGVKNVLSDGSFQLETIPYQYYSPAKFELLSLVSPYGINLDLTKEGKNFVFDVTDYAPILRGSKRLSMELGGENQEEFNIRFQFIKGKAARPVIDVQNVYTFNRGWFGNIIRDEVFEPRILKTNATSQYFKLRTTITGHDQNGEFVSQSHYLKVDGNKNHKKFDFDVWKECGDNPIYPQGGTWIFDRAGWCPGAASDVHQFDITDLTDGGQPIGIDYGLNGTNLDAANYLVSCQLVSYGSNSYAIDAGIESIIRPNAERVEYERFNPSCSRPAILVKNYGTTEITSILFRYKVINGDFLEYNYKGSLKPFEIQQIELPMKDMSFWNSSKETQFSVEIVRVNDVTDENPRNNLGISKFKLVKIFDFDPIFEVRTNKVDADNSYRILDMNGNVLIDNPNLPALSTIQENLKLPNGCYTLQVTDQANDGLSFWFFPELGNGSLGFKKKVGASLITSYGFKPDFGAGIQFDFIMNKPNSISDSKDSYLLSLFPNPSSGEVYISLQSVDHSTASIKIFSNTGNLIFHENWNKTDQRNFEKLTVPNLEPGIYMVQIQLNSGLISRKLIIE